MAESVTRKRLIWIVGGLGAALIAAMLIVKIWFAATVFMPLDEAAQGQIPQAESLATQAVASQSASSQSESSQSESTPYEAAADTLDPEERIARDMVTPVVPGTPVMPDLDEALNPADYSRALAAAIPIEVGMDRYLATDALLLYYNASPDNGAKVSSTERMIDGATLMVIRRSGLSDDSLAAEETYALFDAGALVDFGSRVQCRRGMDAHRWGTTLCP